MSNKTLFLYLSVVVLAFGGWMAWDLHQSQETNRRKDYQHDFVSDHQGGFGAEAQYDFTFPTPTIRHDLSTDEIGRVSTQTLEANTKLPGLTDTKFHLETTYHFRSSRRWIKGGYEMWVNDLVVHFGFDEMTVYISKDYSEDSCQYQAVLAHEKEHVEAHRKVWNDFQPLLQQSVRRAVDIPSDKMRGVFASEAEGRDKIEKAISSVTDPVFEEFRKADNEAQAGIDSRSSYEGVKEKCGSW